MPRGISFCIGMLLTLSLFAQNEGSTFVTPDSSGLQTYGKFQKDYEEVPQFQRFRH